MARIRAFAVITFVIPDELFAKANNLLFMRFSPRNALSGIQEAYNLPATRRGESCIRPELDSGLFRASSRTPLSAILNALIFAYMIILTN